MISNRSPSNIDRAWVEGLPANTRHTPRKARTRLTTPDRIESLSQEEVGAHSHHERGKVDENGRPGRVRIQQSEIEEDKFDAEEETDYKAVKESDIPVENWLAGNQAVPYAKGGGDCGADKGREYGRKPGVCHLYGKIIDPPEDGECQNKHESREVHAVFGHIKFPEGPATGARRNPAREA